jgi:hypothetical protein
MSGNHEYNGWELQLNYGRRDDAGRPGLWEWAGSAPGHGLVWSGVLSGYRPPELPPEEFAEAQRAGEASKASASEARRSQKED